MKVIKQTMTSYSVEQGNKVVGWIHKEKDCYKVEIKNGMFKDVEYFSGFYEAKKEAIRIAIYHNN